MILTLERLNLLRPMTVGAAGLSRFDEAGRVVVHSKGDLLLLSATGCFDFLTRVLLFNHRYTSFPPGIGSRPQDGKRSEHGLESKQRGPSSLSRPTRARHL